MAAITRQIPNGSFHSTKSNQSLIYTGSPNSSCGGGILANAHEAPKKPIKPADGSFTSALKAAFIPPQAGKQMKYKGKPLGKSFERTSPLSTKGHDGGEVLKRDPRGENAKVGDGVVWTSEHEVEVSPPWTPLTATSSNTSSTGDVQSQDGDWFDSSAPHRGRSSTTASSGTTDTASCRSMSQSSGSSSNNPCRIKFAPLPSSGRLKRANSITIGVAARSHLLQSQGSGRSYNSNSNAAAWQAAQVAAQKKDTLAGNAEDVSKREAVLRHGDTMDLGEELRKGVLKAFRKMRKTNGEGGDERPTVKELEGLKVQDGHEGELTPKRSSSPTITSSFPPRPENGQEESDGTRTPRQRRLSTGAFTGNNPLMEIEESRTRAIRGEVDDEREQLARFSQALGRTHATTAAHHTKDDDWHPGMLLPSWGSGKSASVDVVDAGKEGEAESEEEYENAHDNDDPEAVEAERMADEALKCHGEKATKAGAVEKMERHH